MQSGTNKSILKVDGYRKTALQAISTFCEEMFYGEAREADPLSFSGNAYSNNGLLFSLTNGTKTYKVIYRNDTGAYEFFE